ncbi:hypothetical protein ACIBF5_09655 [Micromonospora sp. NPDC050417]|uniref:hypothetical protein n=1 Tax=Micromonospora sp. NPDC050417 TaxID=3364280 RepID=UPI0037AB6549
MSTWLVVDYPATTHTHLDHIDGTTRYWVIGRPGVAVSLTALVVPAGMPYLHSAVEDPDGDRLLADRIAVHRPGSDRHCPLFATGCDPRGGVRPGAPQLLARWAAAGHDDNVIQAALAEICLHEAKKRERYRRA